MMQQLLASGFDTSKTVTENKSKDVNARHPIRTFLLFPDYHAFLLIYMLFSFPFIHTSIAVI